MKKIIAHFIKYPIYSNAIILVTALVGIISLSIMPRSFFPELSPNKIYINVAYPGASPEEIEQGITTRVEESLNGIEGIEEIKRSEDVLSPIWGDHVGHSSKKLMVIRDQKALEIPCVQRSDGA